MQIIIDRDKLQTAIAEMQDAQETYNQKYVEVKQAEKEYNEKRHNLYRLIIDSEQYEAPTSGETK